MKVRSLLTITLGLIMSGIISPLILAQSQRYPTNTEMRQAILKFRQMIPSFLQSSQFGKGKREKGLDSFVEAWSRVDSAAAPLLGSWQGQETDWNIYPSKVRGRVCIIFRSPAEVSPGASFGLGYASDGQIRTNEVTTMVGRNHLVFVREDKYLGIASVDSNNKAGIFPYSAFSNALQPVSKLLSYLPPKQKSKIMQKFQAAGCTSSYPKVNLS